MSGRLQRMLQAVWPPPMRTEKWKDLIPCRFPVNHLYLQARRNLTCRSSTMDKTIAVLGTGANGSCVAVDLTNAGLDVVLIDQWPAHVEAMRANGLHVTLRQGEIHAKVRAHHLCELASMHQLFDVVFLAAKAYEIGRASCRERVCNGV